ncbi:T4-like virus tail tube protein gp19 [uncultured archaeon]|nr:T4-like virus tail tube protein gp19 [uncultured archaeon]
MAEYRAGNKKDNAVDKITTRYKVPDVTLKRGVIGSLDMYLWINDVRNGKQDALRPVTITLQSEDRIAEAQKWKLLNARPIKYTGPALSGKGTELAIEELVLACERIEVE